MMGLEQRKRTQSRARQNRRNQPRCLFWWVPMSRLGVDSAELPMRSGHVKRRSDATTKTNPGSRPIKTTPSLLGNILCFELNQLRTQHLKTNFLQPRACPSSLSFSIPNRIERQLLHLRFPPNAGSGGLIRPATGVLRKAIQRTRDCRGIRHGWNLPCAVDL